MAKWRKLGTEAKDPEPEGFRLATPDQSGRQAGAEAEPSEADVQAEADEVTALKAHQGQQMADEAAAGEPAPILTLEPVRIASNDEWAFAQADRLQKRLPDRVGGRDRKTEGEVFDAQTLMTLHRLLTHGVLKSLDFPISTGKEANVFRGTTPRGGYLAVKIYRTNTATFKHVLQYIQGDERFEGVAGDKRGLTHAWCQKEFRNLVRLREAGVFVPEPIKAIANVLVTEYIGIKAGQYPTLKEVGRLSPEQAEMLWAQVREAYIMAYNVAGLIHADFSEYNIMLEGAGGPLSQQKARMMDVGQAVLWNHPMAVEFLERDLRNITTYFRRMGADAMPDQIRSRLQAPDPSVRKAMARAERLAAFEGDEEPEEEEDDGDEE